MSEETEEMVETEGAAPATQRCPIQQEVYIELDLNVQAETTKMTITYSSTSNK